MQGAPGCRRAGTGETSPRGAHEKRRDGQSTLTVIHLGRVRRADDGESRTGRDQGGGRTMDGDRTHLLIPIHVDALVVGENDRDSDSFLRNGTVSAAPN